VGQADGYTWVWENTLSYNNTFAERHSVNAVAGITAQQYEATPVVVSRAGIEDGRLGYHAIQEGTKIQLANTGYSSWQMLSYLARVNYGYDSRYLLTLTGVLMVLLNSVQIINMVFPFYCVCLACL